MTATAVIPVSAAWAPGQTLALDLCLKAKQFITYIQVLMSFD
jgi:hypothetical protein